MEYTILEALGQNIKATDFLLENTLLVTETFSTFISLVLLIIYWKRCDRSPLLVCFTVLQILVAFHVISHVFIHLTEIIKLNSIYFTYAKKAFFINSQMVWVILCWVFINKNREFNWQILHVLILPTIYTLLIFTNDWHMLLGKVAINHFEDVYDVSLQATRFCKIFQYIIYTFAIPYIYKICIYLLNQKGYLRLQGILLLFAGIIPPLVYLFDSNHSIFPFSFDPVPISSTISTLLFAIATFRYKLFNLIPIAFREFVENMGSSVLILDINNKKIYSNFSFYSEFPMLSLNKYAHIKDVLNTLRPWVQNHDELDKIEKLLESSRAKRSSLELNVLQTEGNKCYLVDFQPIVASNEETIGKMLSFYDITDYKNLLNTLSQKNTELLHAYNQLKDYTSTVEELTAARERNILARNTHDTLGQIMTSLISILNMSLKHFDEYPEKAKEDIMNAVHFSKKGYHELRKVIYSFSNMDYKNKPGIEKLNELFCDFRNAGIHVDFHSLGNLDLISSIYWESLYKICQEAVTNSIKHGHAKTISIILRRDDGFMNVYIFDNGMGCKKIIKGIGLTGIECRVKELNGVVTFGSDGESGFYININIRL